MFVQNEELATEVRECMTTVNGLRQHTERANYKVSKRTAAKSLQHNVQLYV